MIILLTSKQRSYLRAIANSQDAIFQIGKAGISPSFIEQIKEALEAREIVKISVLDNIDLSAREACNIVTQETGADGVQVIGNKFVIYKRSKERPKIELP